MEKSCKLFQTVVILCVGSRLGSGASDYQLFETRCDRLLYSLHESGNQYPLQDAREQNSFHLLLPQTTPLRHMDVPHCLIHRYECSFLSSFEQVQVPGLLIKPFSRTHWTLCA